MSFLPQLNRVSPHSPPRRSYIYKMPPGGLLTLVFEVQKGYEKLFTDSSSLSAYLRRFSCGVELTTCTGMYKHLGTATDLRTVEHDGRRKQHVLKGDARELKA